MVDVLLVLRLIVLEEPTSEAVVIAAYRLIRVILPRVSRIRSIRPLILVERIQRISVKLSGRDLAKLVITFR